MKVLTNLVKNVLEPRPILTPLLVTYLQKEYAKNDKAMVIADAKLTVATFKERILEFNHRDDVEGEFFHPSAIGQCMRKLWFDEFKAPKDSSPQGLELIRTHLTFEIGTYAHVIFQNLCEMAGVLVKREISIRDAKRRVLGHADGIVRINGERYLLEIKTSNSRTFLGLAAPNESHLKQTHLYMASLGLRKGIIVYIDKDRSVLKEFVVDFDKKLYLTQCQGRISVFFKHVRERTPPNKEGTNPQVMPCLYCPYKLVCFDVERLNRFMKTMKTSKAGVHSRTLKPKIKLKLKRRI